jgi:two-component system, NarL family, response regulator NreC
VHPQAQIQQEGISNNRKIRCLLVHSHVLLRQGLRRLLEDEPDMEIVAEGTDASEAIQKVFEHRPDVVITDVGTFGCAPHQVERLVQRESPTSKLLFLNLPEGHVPTYASPHESRSAARQTSVEELVEMVREAHSPETVLREMPRRGRSAAIDRILPRKRALTAREREVLKLLAEGRTVRSAASVMGLSVKTVDAHKFNLMRKLGIHNKAELVMWAIQKKVVRLPANF